MSACVRRNRTQCHFDAPVYNLILFYRGVAQFGRALRSGRRGRVFESRHPDHKNKARQSRALFLCFDVHFDTRSSSPEWDAGQNLSVKGFAAITKVTRNRTRDTTSVSLEQSPPPSPRATRCNYSGIVILCHKSLTP